jgi:valyl-tRNA synthetase
MSEIPKAYEPQSVESKWYQFWLDQNAFTANPHSTKPAYSIVIPPPNVTGVLTLGHVLNNTIQDILARKARMDGKEVLWQPGIDHAGIATQTVVERTLKKAGEIRHRDDLGREKFLERVWEWKEKHGGIILQQLKALGASCDWTRTRFTMDPEYSRCVTRVFVDLYKKGLIYRGKRMVNWCPVSLTALSDEEVIMKEQKGFMYHFKVEVAEQPDTFLTIATTRPETIPGDTAVAVNPKDPRYAQLIGKHVVRPLPAELPKKLRLLPIVPDEHVDFEFGTGVLKVTPAHDKADFEIYNRLVAKGIAENNTELGNMLPIEVIGPDGVMTEDAGEDLQGLDRFKARKVALEKLTALGALEKEEPYTNNVGFSERADVPIEPRLSAQWFLKYPSVAKSKDCVLAGAMKFYPERWAKVYDHWMSGIQDWCISRQLWWGHRIPVWYPKTSLKDGYGLEAEIVDDSNSNKFYVGIEPPPDLENWEQDPDVLDTWFSSWLWPFATMGWPENTDTLKKFYPTTDLVTGPDIIFFWVARMIMAGYEWMGEMPFRNVYFTGIIRDKLGRKMSKSLGNSPDPLDLINKYGADALRFGIMRSAPQGQDLLFDEQSVELGRNFCNKLWNACRFRQMQGGESEGEINTSRLTSDDKWILLKLDAAIREVTDALNNYKFNEAANTLYRFFWSEFCDWYLESAKAALNVEATDERTVARRTNTLAVIDFALSNTLRLFHPFLPFITEELWHGMGFNGDLPKEQGGDTIMFARWPKAFDQEMKDFYALDDCYLERVEAKHELVRQGRNLRSEARIAANKKVHFVLKPTDGLPPHDINVIKILLNAERFEVNPEFQAGKGTARTITPLGELFLPLEGLIDVTAERSRLQKELEKVRSEIEKVSQKLSNPNFTQKVPPQVLAEHQQRLNDWNTRHAQVLAALEGLQG